jgi:excisionase family DNA binding protein
MPLAPADLDAIAQAVAARLQPTVERRYLSVEEAARYSSLSPESVRRLLAAGKLTPLRPVRGRIVIDRRQLDALVLGSTRRPTGGRGQKQS